MEALSGVRGHHIDLVTILQDFFRRRSDIALLAHHTHSGPSGFSRYKRRWEKGIAGANSTLGTHANKRSSPIFPGEGRGEGKSIAPKETVVLLVVYVDHNLLKTAVCV